jgi:phosphatidylserine/phosphatidylglycerophosphate/cardiolipin synthase-like enzyme
MAKRGGSSSALWFFIMLLVLAGVVVYFQRQRRRDNYKIEHAAEGQIVSENHLAPTEDLEAIDLDRLEGAKKTVDIAMYAFTDRALGEEVIKLARRGVHVRIYRDGEQYEEEQKNAAQYGDTSVNDMLRGEGLVEVRMKPRSRRDLMHLKAYAIDGRLLRDGSANWSQAGEKAQDNNARFTNDPEEIRNFERDFEAMWARAENLKIQ